MDLHTALKAFTRIVLMLPIPITLYIGGKMLLSGAEMQQFAVFSTGFAAIYVPALTAYITGTSVKRAQEKRK